MKKGWNTICSRRIVPKNYVNDPEILSLIKNHLKDPLIEFIKNHDCIKITVEDYTPENGMVMVTGELIAWNNEEENPELNSRNLRGR